MMEYKKFMLKQLSTNTIKFLYESYYSSWDSEERTLLLNHLVGIDELCGLNNNYWPPLLYWKSLDQMVTDNQSLKEVLDQRLLLYKLSI